MIILKEKERKEFSDDTIKIAWLRSGGRCECMRKTHGHKDRCNKILKYDQQGRDTDDHWEAHHRNSDTSKNDVDHCLIFCWECHSKTMGEDSEINKRPMKLGVRIPKK
jgi:hypothetical protein